MKLKIETWCDSGANSKSSYVSEFEIDSEEWESMSEAEKDDYAKDVAWGRLDWGWKVRDSQ